MINPSAMDFIEEQLYVNESEVRQLSSPPVIDVDRGDSEGNKDSEETKTAKTTKARIAPTTRTLYHPRWLPVPGD